MPAATNISQIHAWDNAIHTAVLAQYAAYGVTAFRPRDREDMPDTYVLPLFTKGAASGHLAKLPPAVGGFEYDLFPSSVFGAEIVAPRVADQSTPEGAAIIAAVYDLLEELATRSRVAFRFNAGDEFNARLEYHKLTHLVPLADVVGYDEDRKLDRYELRWQCTAGIRPTAWPTDPAAYVIA